MVIASCTALSQSDVTYVKVACGIVSIRIVGCARPSSQVKEPCSSHLSSNTFLFVDRTCRVLFVLDYFAAACRSGSVSSCVQQPYRGKNFNYTTTGSVFVWNGWRVVGSCRWMVSNISTRYTFYAQLRENCIEPYHFFQLTIPWIEAMKLLSGSTPACSLC